MTQARQRKKWGSIFLSLSVVKRSDILVRSCSLQYKLFEYRTARECLFTLLVPALVVRVWKRHSTTVNVYHKSRRLNFLALQWIVVVVCLFLGESHIYIQSQV
jgi:hypothetical protein